MALPDKFRVLSPLYHDQEIGDNSFRFYTNSVKAAAKTSQLLEELAAHVSVLLGKTSQDQGHIVEDFKDPETGASVEKTSVPPINPDLARLRSEERQKAVRGAIKALLNAKHRMTIAELLMDSLRDDWDRAKPHPSQEIQEFLDGMDMPTLVSFIKGWATANAKLFGELGNVMSGPMKAAQAEIVGQVKASLAGLPAAVGTSS